MTSSGEFGRGVKSLRRVWNESCVHLALNPRRDPATELIAGAVVPALAEAGIRTHWVAGAEGCADFAPAEGRLLQVPGYSAFSGQEELEKILLRDRISTLILSGETPAQMICNTAMDARDAGMTVIMLQARGAEVPARLRAQDVVIVPVEHLLARLDPQPVRARRDDMAARISRHFRF